MTKVPKFPKVPKGPVLPKHPVVPKGAPTYMERPNGARIFWAAFKDGPWKGMRAYMPTGFATLTINIGGHVGRYVGNTWEPAQ